MYSARVYSNTFRFACTQSLGKKRGPGGPADLLARSKFIPRTTNAFVKKLRVPFSIRSGIDNGDVCSFCVSVNGEAALVAS